jgi:ferredoxin
LASTDAHALDAVMCRIFGLGPEDVFTLAAAQDAGLLGPIDEIEVIGEHIDDLKLKKPLKMARPSPANRLTSSEGLSRLADRLMSLSPAVDQAKCTACGQCVEVCAAGAIEVSEEAEPPYPRMAIDEKKCISCFCCQEICPEGAISVKAGLGARIFGIGTRKSGE